MSNLLVIRQSQRTEVNLVPRATFPPSQQFVTKRIIKKERFFVLKRKGEKAAKWQKFHKIMLLLLEVNFQAWSNTLQFNTLGLRSSRLKLSPARKSPHVRESKTLLDSGFHAVDSGFHLLDSRSFSVELGFRIRIVSGIPDSYTCIPDSKAQDSGFHKQKFPRFRIQNAKIFRIPLHGATKSWVMWLLILSSC